MSMPLREEILQQKEQNKIGKLQGESMFSEDPPDIEWGYRQEDRSILEGESIFSQDPSQ